ncbi:hypothetical protein [Pectobacterium atrosepticum]|uniref:hypothetical protein n=1 Tax=Pectobacterium atrosepticum TaxID=29471 RepID=UPI000D61FAE2|nr:hypothetical protein [Pectobacterium atrosepticum]PWD61040.1 hypothetical protein DF214_09295 [Pectobacterium atrosepticum]
MERHPALRWSNPLLVVVILVVLTEIEFRFSLLISQLLAKAIPVRGAKFLFSCLFTNPYVIQIQ